MKLIELVGKSVRLVDRDGEVFEGVIGDYIYPEDNYPTTEEGIILDCLGKENPVQFNKSEITSIQAAK